MMDIKIPFNDSGFDIIVTDDEMNKFKYIAKSTEYSDDLRVYVARLRARLKPYGATAEIENGKVVIYYGEKQVEV